MSGIVDLSVGLVSGTVAAAGAYSIARSSGEFVGEAAMVARKGYKSAGRHADAPQSDSRRICQLEDTHD